MNTKTKLVRLLATGAIALAGGLVATVGIAGAHEITTARCRIVSLERFEQVVERDLERPKSIGENLHFVGLELAAEGVDFDDSWHRAQLVGHEPVEHRA